MPGELEGDFITESCYTNYLRGLKVQKFVLNAVQYEIRYKEFKYDVYGRILGYRAQLVNLANKK